jgi:prepilin-type N-terminal cleavage/methylation domain-containing protein
MELKNRTIRKSQRKRQGGFSLIELLMAMIVLTIGLLGGMIVIVTAVASNARNRFDTAAVALAQSTMDRIIVLSAGAAGQTTQMTDCNGTVFTLTTVGAASPGTGAPLIDFVNVTNGNQVIDFTQAPVAGYQMLYTLCAAGASDPLVVGNPQVYDVRWNIQTVNGTPNQEMILVAAKNVTEVGNGNENQSRLFAMPITLRALRGN